MGLLQRWLVIAVALPCTIVTWGASLSAFALVSLGWAKDFGASHAETSLALTLLTLGQGACGPLAGYAVGKLSIRMLLLLGLGLSAAGFVLVGVATGAGG